MRGKVMLTIHPGMSARYNHRFHVKLLFFKHGNSFASRLQIESPLFPR